MSSFSHAFLLVQREHSRNTARSTKKTQYEYTDHRVMISSPPKSLPPQYNYSANAIKMCNRDPSPRPSSSSNWEEGEMTKRRPGAFCPHKRSQYVEAPTHKESMCGGSSTKGINMWRLLHKWNQYVEAPSTNGIGVNMWRLPPQME